jgi:aminoglycoside phosphotransferase (APT) family kinase protein
VQGLAAISLQRSSQSARYLLHGDCGPYNFVFRGRRLSGVLDAAPVLGEPLLDLATAFTAWPGDFSLDALTPALRALANWQPTSQRALVEDVLVVLYGQTVACLIYHPADFPRYLEAWAYWRGLLRAA